MAWIGSAVQSKWEVGSAYLIINLNALQRELEASGSPGILSKIEFVQAGNDLGVL